MTLARLTVSRPNGAAERACLRVPECTGVSVSEYECTSLKLESSKTLQVKFVEGRRAVSLWQEGCEMSAVSCWAQRWPLFGPWMLAQLLPTAREVVRSARAALREQMLSVQYENVVLRPRFGAL